MENIQAFWEKIKSRKIFLALFIIGLFFIGIIVFIFISLFLLRIPFVSSPAPTYSPGYSPDGYLYSPAAGTGGGGVRVSSPLGGESLGLLDRIFDTGTGDAPERTAEKAFEDSAELQIREGNFKVKSGDAQDDMETLKNAVHDFNGYVEQSRKSETNLFIRITATVRVPVNDFEEFLQIFHDRFEVESFEIRDFRINVQRQLDELEIIARAHQELQNLRQEVAALPADSRRIDLLMNITNKELDLSRREAQFQRDLVSSQRRADMATFVVVFDQTVKAKVWPENLANRFRDSLRRSLDNVANAVIGTGTDGLALLARVVQLIVYAFIIVLPVWGTILIVKRLRKRLANWQKKEQG